MKVSKTGTSYKRSEKVYWILAGLTYLLILSTIFLMDFLSSRPQGQQAVVFLLGMLLVGGSVLFHILPSSPRRIFVLIAVGILALLLMLTLRLSLAERSHLIEYGVLAVFVHRAFLLRYETSSKFRSALHAFTLCFVLGAVDELIQHWMPQRHFDPVDIAFNSMAILLPILGHWIFEKLFHRFNLKKK